MGSTGEKEIVYGCMMDAGSTGSRIHVYKFEREKGVSAGRPVSCRATHFVAMLVETRCALLFASLPYASPKNTRYCAPCLADGAGPAAHPRRDL